MCKFITFVNQIKFQNSNSNANIVRTGPKRSEGKQQKQKFIQMIMNSLQSLEHSHKLNYNIVDMHVHFVIQSHWKVHSTNPFFSELIWRWLHLWCDYRNIRQIQIKEPARKNE